eukprot:4465692-Lingulodinium_polyedra.AAC.1
MLYANGTCKIGPGNPAEWRSAGRMAGQNPDQMQQYLVSQICDPLDAPRPDADVTNGMVNPQNLSEYEN